MVVRPAYPRSDRGSSRRPGGGGRRQARRGSAEGADDIQSSGNHPGATTVRPVILKAG